MSDSRTRVQVIDVWVFWTYSRWRENRLHWTTNLYAHLTYHIRLKHVTHIPIEHFNQKLKCEKTNEYKESVSRTGERKHISNSNFKVSPLKESPWCIIALSPVKYTSLSWTPGSLLPGSSIVSSSRPSLIINRILKTCRPCDAATSCPAMTPASPRPVNTQWKAARC